MFEKLPKSQSTSKDIVLKYYFSKIASLIVLESNYLTVNESKVKENHTFIYICVYMYGRLLISMASYWINMKQLSDNLSASFNSD